LTSFALRPLGKMLSRLPSFSLDVGSSKTMVKGLAALNRLGCYLRPGLQRNIVATKETITALAWQRGFTIMAQGIAEGGILV
jgi:hypothetical protein